MARQTSSPSSRGSITSSRTRSHGAARNRSSAAWPSAAVSNLEPAPRRPSAVISRIDGSSSTSRILASTPGSSRSGSAAGVRSLQSFARQGPIAALRTRLVDARTVVRRATVSICGGRRSPNSPARCRSRPSPSGGGGAPERHPWRVLSRRCVTGPIAAELRVGRRRWPMCHAGNEVVLPALSRLRRAGGLSRPCPAAGSILWSASAVRPVIGAGPAGPAESAPGDGRSGSKP